MRYVVTVIIFIILSDILCIKASADVSYADIFLHERGYKPVEDAWSLQPEENILMPDNEAYRQWCMRTFENGEQIYEAYKEIAFGIDYRAEPPRTDYWQTPLETKQRKQGDCEDSIFLFFSLLSKINIDGDIVWGWVVDRKSATTFAHVWYQLFDKYGKPYIVEGFSKAWNGIIPVEMLTAEEERIPTLLLKHTQVTHVAEEMTPVFTGFFEDAQFLFDNHLTYSSLVQNILQKLRDMFHRYTEQINKPS